MNTMDNSKKVLIVEDDTSLLHALSEKLTDEGFEVDTATTVSQALSIIHDTHPDAIILDIMLPGGKHGFDLLEQLSDTPYPSKTIVLTNLDTEMKVTKDLGVKEYLIKSDTNITDIVKKIRAICNHHTKSKILIIEDDPSLRQALSDKLTRTGFETCEAKNGEEGIQKAIRVEPDLILLDIIMPVMDGLTMMKKLREHEPWGKTVPIILLTNLGGDDDRIIKHISLYKPAYYLVKADWEIEDVVEKVNGVLHNG